MSPAHPIKRAQVAIAVFALCGLGIGFGADPVRPLATTGADVNAPTAVAERTSSLPARRAWREQLPAVILIRRVARPS